MIFCKYTFDDGPLSVGSVCYFINGRWVNIVSFYAHGLQHGEPTVNNHWTLIK